MRAAGAGWWLCSPLLLGGCVGAPRLDPGAISDPGFGAIYAQYAESVARCNNDTKSHWHHGWAGNGWVLLLGDSRRGLCHQWQSRVLADISDVTQEHGWRVAPIGREVGGFLEHHAVLLYDPKTVNDDAGAFVLDPWRRGQPDVYALDDWR